MSRALLFSQSISSFLTKFSYPDSNEKYGISSLDFKLEKTDTKLSYQTFELKIKKDKVVLLDEYDDMPIMRSERNYSDINIPNFMNAFNDYYKLYSVYENNECWSYVKMRDNIYSEDNNYIKFIINIQYYKHYIPFQHKQTEKEKLINLENQNKKLITKNKKLREDFEFNMIELDQMEEDNRLLEKKIKKLKISLENSTQRGADNYKRSQKLWRSMYANNPRQDCPVCYEEIEPEKLIVPMCSHIICDTCVRKCDSCPLCRDTYDHYIEFNEEPVINPIPTNIN